MASATAAWRGRSSSATRASPTTGPASSSTPARCRRWCRRDGQVVANVSSDNGEHGILFDVTLGAAGTGYVFRGNRCDGNGKAGIKLHVQRDAVIAGVAVVDNDVHANGSLGRARRHGRGPCRRPDDHRQPVCRQRADELRRLHPGHPHRRLDRPFHDHRQRAAGTTAPHPARPTASSSAPAPRSSTGHVAGNHVTGNAVGGLDLAGTLVGCRVTDNTGHTPAGIGPLAPGPSPWTYTAGPAPEVLYLSGGSVRAVAKGGGQIAARRPSPWSCAPTSR